jgi:tetratricopeptide (TPR) repeat protein
MNNKQYYTSICCHHGDNTTQGRQWAHWLHQEIETYIVPKALVGKINGRGEKVPAKIYPTIIIETEPESAGNTELSQAIIDTLDSSRQLIVLCSPEAATSKYLTKSVDYFKTQGRKNQIIAAIIHGEPNVNRDSTVHPIKVNPQSECFPKPLQFEYDNNGLPTKNRADLLGADFRVINHKNQPEQGWTNPEAYHQHLKSSKKYNNKDISQQLDRYKQQMDLMLLKVIAGILALPLGDLTQRDQVRQLEQTQKKLTTLRRWSGAIAILAIIALSMGAVSYIQQEQAIHAEQISSIERDKAEVLLKEIEKTLVFINNDLRSVLTSYVPTAQQANILKDVDRLVNTLKTHGQNNHHSLAEQAMALVNKTLVILQNAQSDPSLALPLLIQARALYQTVIQQNPANNQYKVLLAQLHTDLGDVYLRLGQAQNAQDAYRASMTIAKRLVEQNPAKLTFQRLMASCQMRFGNIERHNGQTDSALISYQTSFSIYQKLLKQNLNDTRLKTNFAIAQMKLAQVFQKLGQTGSALTAFQASQTMMEQLLTQDPTNSVLKRYLSVSHGNLGDIYLQLGQLNDALTAFHTAKNFYQQLTKQDPANTGFKRDLSLSYQSLGKTYLRLNQAGYALTLYLESLKIQQALAIQDPANTYFQQGLATTQGTMGDVFRQTRQLGKAAAAYQKSLALIKKQAIDAPNNTLLQRNLGVVHIKSGDVSLQLGKADQALQSFQSALLIRQKLNKQDPENVELLRDLTVNYNKLGEIYLQRRDLNDALNYFQTALSIIENLTKQDPQNHQVQRSLAICHWNMYRVTWAMGQHGESLVYVEKARDQFIQMNKTNTLRPGDFNKIDQANSSIAEIKRHIAKRNQF